MLHAFAIGRVQFCLVLKIINFFFFAVALRPDAGHDLILEISRSHTTTHYSR